MAAGLTHAPATHACPPQEEVGASTDETDETDEAVAALGRAVGPKWYARPGAPLGSPAAATAA